MKQLSIIFFLFSFVFYLQLSFSDEIIQEWKPGSASILCQTSLRRNDKDCLHYSNKNKFVKFKKYLPNTLALNLNEDSNIIVESESENENENGPTSITTTTHRSLKGKGKKGGWNHRWFGKGKGKWGPKHTHHYHWNSFGPLPRGDGRIHFRRRPTRPTHYNEIFRNNDNNRNIAKTGRSSSKINLNLNFNRPYDRPGNVIGDAPNIEYDPEYEEPPQPSPPDCPIPDREPMPGADGRGRRPPMRPPPPPLYMNEFMVQGRHDSPSPYVNEFAAQQSTFIENNLNRGNPYAYATNIVPNIYQNYPRNNHLAYGVRYLEEDQEEEQEEENQENQENQEKGKHV
jgi:hypothetical protein